jgi:hypothetical protein
MVSWTMAALLFSQQSRHTSQAVSSLSQALVSRNDGSAGAGGIGEMRRVGKLLRSMPSRIGRRLAVIVAIAAASLPSAGA